MNTSKQIQNLREIFNELSYSHNVQIDTADMLEFLDSRCPNGHFDRDVFEQLCDQIKPQQRGRITINEFINVALKAQGILSDKIIASNQQLEQKLQSQAQYNELLNRSKSTESYYATSQISRDSLLNIEIMEAHLMYASQGQMQISIQFANQVKQTQFALKTQLQWNQSFDFNVTSANEEIEIILVDTELSDRMEIGGITHLNLSTFDDQLVHDFWVDLSDRSKQKLRGRLHIKVQWIYSKQEYLIELMKQNGQQIAEIRQEISDHKVDLDLLFQPFLKPAKQLDDISKPELPVIIESYSAQPQSAQTQEQIDRLLRISLLLTVIYLLISVLTGIDRCVFQDYLVIFYSFIFYQKNHRLQSLLHIKIILAMLTIVILIDIVWLSIYSTPYLGEFNPMFDHLENALYKYAVIISWIMLMVKIANIAFYIHIYATYPDKQTQVYDQQWHSIFGTSTKQQPNFTQTKSVYNQAFPTYKVFQ